jgi:L-arabinose isomerase
VIRAAGRPRAGVIHPYWTLWEHTASPSFRGDRMALARAVAEDLTDTVDAVAVDEIASATDGETVGRKFADLDVEVVLVLQTMAVPAAWTMAAIELLPGVPVVVCALHEAGLGDRVDHGTITTQGATVGAPMLSNLLSRADRAFDLVLVRRSDPDGLERLGHALRLAGIARRISRSRLGRIGRPLDGYAHVDVDDAELRAATGIELVAVDPDEVVDRYRAVPDADVRALEADVRRDWTLVGDLVEGETLERSLRAALALESVVDAHDLDGGAFNCHVPQFRFGDTIGIAPCWALGRLTSGGRPFTCTGDIVTAVAMLTTKRLGGAAVYHEIETIDYDSGEVVIANSGEHDLAWLADGERPRLQRNDWFCGKDAHCGVCAAFEPSPGPATLVGFTPRPRSRGGFRYVVARGELTARRFPETGTVNGAFRFADGPVEAAWARWARAGVNHHSSATPGDLAADVVAVANHLAIDAVVV